MMKKYLATVLITICTMSLFGCGATDASSDTNRVYGNALSIDSTESSSKNDYVSLGAGVQGYDDTYADSYEEINNYDNSNNESNTSNESNIKIETSGDQKIIFDEKLVYSCSMDMETKSYDSSYLALRGLIEKHGGIIENERFSDSNSYLSDYRYSGVGIQRKVIMTIRIPSSNYYSFLSETAECDIHITSKNSSVENITQTYYDTQTSLEGLKTQLARLESMLEVTYDIDDLIRLNDRISQLEIEIAQQQTVIRRMDTDVAYSYVNIELSEVAEYTEIDEPIKTNTFFDRLKNQIDNTWNGFLSFCEWLLFTIIGLIPAIIILGIILIIIRLLFWKKIKASFDKRKEEDKMMKAILSNNQQIVNKNDIGDKLNDADKN